ncbi:MAG: FliM/FliN family flagellar motor C-terminal domain-containing protein [Phycisphaerales bacterium]
MGADPARILSLEVPLKVRLGERAMTMGEVLALAPGSIIELPKTTDSDLEVLVNNRLIGSGTAVKVGENFGIRLTTVGGEQGRAQAAIAATQAQRKPA